MSRNTKNRLWPVLYRPGPRPRKPWTPEASRAAGDRAAATEFDVYDRPDVEVVRAPGFVSMILDGSLTYRWIAKAPMRRKSDIDP